MEIMGVLMNFFFTEIETLFCWIFASYGMNSLFLVSKKSYGELASGVNSKLFGNSLFVTELLAFSVSMLIQHKQSMFLLHVSSPRIKKKSDVKIGLKLHSIVLNVV